MLARWFDIEKESTNLDELHRRMGRVFGEMLGGWEGFPQSIQKAGSWPVANLYDTGSAFTAIFRIPGVAEGDLKVEVQGDVLTVGGERKSEVPKGYHVHRSERGTQRFSRSFGLPCSVDPEKTKATLRDGVLTVTMNKHPNAQPKQIKIKSNQ